ncbi:MAG: molecular chaperone DnaJ [Planctomycetota bacterium]
MPVAAAKRDYYEILGVKRDATPDEIKSAFRQLALKWHPDRNPNNKAEAEERFKEIAEAYAVLSDEAKRHQYDQFGHEGLSGGGPDFHGASIEDILNQFFGGRGGLGGSFFDDLFGGGHAAAEAAGQGASLRYDLEIDLEQAYQGITKTVEITREELCETCHGSGAKPGSRPVTCSICRGSGVMTRSSGFFVMRTTCGRCGGRGKVVATPCTDCRGTGRQPKRVRLEVGIPAGIEDNTRIRLQGQGESGDGGRRGDLYIFVHVREHEVFVRRGNDILLQVPIPFTMAALGGEFEIPTLQGRARLTIPRGTQSGRLLKMAGFGMPDVHGYSKGDQLVRVVIGVPKQLSPEQEELLRKLAALEKTGVTPQKRPLLGKIRDFFSEE